MTNRQIFDGSSDEFPFDYQKIYGRDHRDGPVQVARYNAISSRVTSFMSSKIALVLTATAIAAGALLVASWGLNVKAQSWAAEAASKASQPLQAVAPNIERGTFRKLLEGALIDPTVPAGQERPTRALVSLEDVLKPSEGHSQDDLTLAFKTYLETGKLPEGFTAMPAPGNLFPPDTASYKVAGKGDDAVMFAALPVLRKDTSSGQNVDALWMGVVHKTKSGSIEVCNFQPLEITQDPGAQPFWPRAPQAKCVITEPMIPRAASEAFGTPISK